MPVIYCKINIFDYEQEVFLGTKSIGKAPLKDLPQFLINRCQENDVREVHLKGIKAYAQDVKNSIENYCQTKYGDLRIEVKIDE